MITGLVEGPTDLSIVSSPRVRVRNRFPAFGRGSRHSRPHREGLWGFRERCSRIAIGMNDQVRAKPTFHHRRSDVKVARVGGG